MNLTFGLISSVSPPKEILVAGKLPDKIFIAPRIRDYVFLPLVFLMFNLQVLRLMVMRYMNEPKNKLLDRAGLSYATLFGTIFEKDADKERRMPDEQVEIVKMLEERTDSDARET